MMYNYLAWDKTVQTLDRVLSVASRPGHCANSTCPGHDMRLLSAEGQQIAPLGSTYGYDVVARIGWLRQERRDIYAEIRADLASQIQISESHVRYLYQQVYLPLLACHERRYRDHLTQAARQHGGLIIALDGLAPVGGEPQLWFIRELLTGLTLRSGWLSQFDHTTFAAFLQPLSQLEWSILAVLSDKQKGLVPAVATVLPGVDHHFCQAHYLRNLAEPLADADSAFKVELRQAVRRAVGSLIRAEESPAAAQSGLLTVTGLLADDSPATEKLAPSRAESDGENALTTTAPPQAPEPPPANSGSAVAPPANAAVANQVVTHLLRHTRYLLTLNGRPPFRLAGIETYERLQGVVDLTAKLLDHRHDPRMAHLHQGLQAALPSFATAYRDLQQGATWLQDISRILEPPDDTPPTGVQVAQRLRAYLDDLLKLADLPPRLDAFRRHLDKVSTSYWPGLFHCYDLEGLPRTNNDLESHFRDTQRRLLRTTGQKGQTSRALQRTGAWELLPRPPTEAQCLTALRQVSPTQLAMEQQRLRQHRERFRLHTRSIHQTNTQFNKLRQQWLSLAATSTG
ncbi:MAG: transposase [Chloroflexi bacterium]|nr:transposase [Chloroflexota bacterium]MBU1749960.1 transposase [Chloroflexota bacterium]